MSSTARPPTSCTRTSASCSPPTTSSRRKRLCRAHETAGHPGWRLWRCHRGERRTRQDTRPGGREGRKAFSDATAYQSSRHRAGSRAQVDGEANTLTQKDPRASHPSHGDMTHKSPARRRRKGTAAWRGAAGRQRDMAYGIWHIWPGKDCGLNMMILMMMMMAMMTCRRIRHLPRDPSGATAGPGTHELRGLLLPSLSRKPVASTSERVGRLSPAGRRRRAAQLFINPAHLSRPGLLGDNERAYIHTYIHRYLA